MNTRQLGKNGPHITELGLGAWAIGGSWTWGWGDQDDDHSTKAIMSAVDAGMNWIDTAAVYGLGHSEIVVGKAVAEIRNDVFIATKCGLPWDDQKRVTKNLHPASIRKECEDSLRRLNVDHIDLYQFHWPHNNMPVEESWGQMTRLVEEGKVRFIGVSNFDVELLQRCQAIAPVQSLQPPYSAVHRDIESEILPWCREHQVGVVAYSPMQSGLLTGKFSHSYMETLQDDDWRKGQNNPYFTEPLFSVVLEFVEKIKPVAESYEKSVAQLAIRWTLEHEAVTSAIVGVRTAEQVERNVKATGWTINADDLARISEIYEETVGRTKE